MRRNVPVRTRARFWHGGLAFGLTATVATVVVVAAVLVWRGVRPF